MESGIGNIVTISGICHNIRYLLYYTQFRIYELRLYGFLLGIFVIFWLYGFLEKVFPNKFFAFMDFSLL